MGVEEMDELGFTVKKMERVGRGEREVSNGGGGMKFGFLYWLEIGSKNGKSSHYFQFFG